MDNQKTLIMVLKIWPILILVIATLGNSKHEGAYYDEHTGRMLATRNNDGFISIDCGVEKDYIHEATSIFYKSDADFISTGVNHLIWPGYTFANPDFTPQLKTVRSLPRGTKNCYTLKPEQGRNNNYLIRALFMYGNYDNKNQVPVFDLYLGVNFYTTVILQDEISNKFYDIVHVPSTDTIYFCLVNTGSGVPFISSLELRHLDSSIYRAHSGMLSMARRFDVGFTSDLTNRIIVDAIIAIMKTYNISRDDWQGDPCLPSDFSWNGLSCISHNPPRIISLNLSSSKLTGKIVPPFPNLKALQSLVLSQNELSGPVPEFLAELQSLKFLNLSGNNITGSVPEVLKEKSRNGALQLSLDEDRNFCLTDSCKEKKKFLVPVVASSISAALLLILLSGLAIFCRIKRKGQQEMLIDYKEGPLESKNRPFNHSEIARITDNFKTTIGEGGFGKVYLGTLNDKTRVAVMCLFISSTQGYKEFQAEALLLMIVHHRNLVSLFGYCDEGDNKALIYEYMANGNLKQHLSGRNKNILNWKERIQIAADAAHGLEYLHNGCKPPIVHRDLKTCNILLDGNMQAKIADFGLSRAFATESDSHVSTRPAGTIGYLDPESHESGVFYKKSDVYSFGIILFELITGQPAIIRGHEYNTHIIQWISPKIEGGDIQNIVDPMLLGDFNINSAWKLVEIAMSCVLPNAIRRPDMSHVLAELEECWAVEMASPRIQRTERQDKME